MSAEQYITGNWTMLTYRRAVGSVRMVVSKRAKKGVNTMNELFATAVDAAFWRNVMCYLGAAKEIILEGTYLS